MDNFDKLISAARKMDADKISIVWDVDGPISIGEDFSMPWIQLLHTPSYSDPKDKVVFINIFELESAKALRDALDRFIKRKIKVIAKEKKRSKNRNRR